MRTESLNNSGDPNVALHSQLTRRNFLRSSGLLTAAVALAQSDWATRMFAPEARAAEPDPLYDTMNGLVAFIVPGSDPYSLHQGASTPDPGGIEANSTFPLIYALNLVSPAPPPFPAFANLVAFVLNQVAQVVNPEVTGPFASPFANLSFAEKIAVWGAMEGGLAGAELVPLAGALPQLVGFIAYSEAGVLDLNTGTLVDTPVGWTLSDYKGVTDGTDDFQGYYKNRMKVD